MFCAQWIQYQLDNYKSVKEVIKHLNEGPNIDWWPNAAGSNFFLTDAEGNSATIALLNNKYTVLKSKDMPMPLLCNSQYHKDLEVVQKYDFLGSNNKFDLKNSNSWEDRFSRVYYILDSYTYDKRPVWEKIYRFNAVNYI